MKNNFEEQLECLINHYSQEAAPDTPDFILSEYMNACLLAFNVAIKRRETWYGRDSKPVPAPTPLKFGDNCPDCRFVKMIERNNGSLVCPRCGQTKSGE